MPSVVNVNQETEEEDPFGDISHILFINEDEAEPHQVVRYIIAFSPRVLLISF